MFQSISASMSTEAELYRCLAVSCARFRHWKVTWSAVIQQMQTFCCHCLHISAVQRLDPAAQQAVLDDQLHVYMIFIFLLFFMSQLWKGLEHILMQFCLSAAYLTYLFPEVLLFTELCSNSSRIIYYDKNFIVKRVVFQIVPRLLSLFCPRLSVRPSVRPLRPSSTACGSWMDALKNSLSSRSMKSANIKV